MKNMVTRGILITITGMMLITGVYSQRTPDLVPFRQGAKFGYTDSNLRVVIPPLYDRAHPFFEGVACVQSGFRCGLINSQGKMLTPFLYEMIGHFGQISKVPIGVTLNGKTGLLDLSGKEVVPARYDDISGVKDHPDLYVITLNEKKGLYHAGKGEILPALYDHITEPKEGVVILRQGDKYGMADLSGKVVTPLQFSYIWEFEYGPITWYLSNNSYGHINNKGIVITDPVYESVWTFVNGFSIVKKAGKFGFIDISGKEVVAPTYDYCADYADGIGIVGMNEKYALIDGKGKLISGFDYYGAWPLTEGMGKVKNESKWGFINNKGKLVIPFRFEDVGQFSEGLVNAREGGKSGYINKKGEWVVQPRYDKAGAFHDGMATVVRDHSVYLLDKSGKELNANGYDSIGVFRNGYALCWRKNKAGILALSGEELLAPAFSQISVANDSRTQLTFFRVNSGKRQGLFNARGGMLLDTLYEIPEIQFWNGLIQIKKEGKYGFADTTGSLVIECRYEDAGVFMHTFTDAKLNGKEGVINTRGEILIPFEYQMLLLNDSFILARKDWQYGLLSPDNKIIAPFIYSDWYFHLRDPLLRLSDATGGETWFDWHGTTYETSCKPVKAVGSDQGSAPMNLTTLHRIRAASNETEYQVMVSLPFHYYETNKSYPVIYLTDADQLQGTVSEATRMMSFDKTIPECIVVGIAYGGTFEDWYSKRIKDLTPTNDPSAALFPGGGGCEAFYQFIQQDLIPLIDREYRTLPQERIFTGYSLGGLFGTWVLFHHPESFQRYMLISPSLWWDGELALQWEKSLCDTSKTLNANIFMSLSEAEWGTPEKLNKTFQSRDYGLLRYHYEEIPGENHYSTFPTAFVKGIKQVFSTEKENLLIR